MSVQVLVAAVNKNEEELITSLNLQTDAIISNQSNENYFRVLDWKGFKIQCMRFSERGVGLNRNNALMRASADFCLFADDDMTYVPDYEKIVENTFSKIKKADVIVFNLEETVASERKRNKKIKRIRWFNFLRYGTARVAIKLHPVRENGILFNLTYGGGTEHSHGEDNIFLADCLRKGLRIYAVPISIATLNNCRESSWNHGYDCKYIKDQGDLYRQISRKYWFLLCLQDAMRRHSAYKMSFVSALRLMIKGK